ncbi:transposase [Vibrio parahaemolyticus]|uniref:IS3 family transposase n=1 Tax=Vibrio parahaemolyticus TaxID=670 RepID=UPI0011234B84|nr:IS3 family transposase [Vibrio parahaemolyticus]EHH1111331.1 transposase [Vibrio parahaemolyticus]EHK0062914.1 transposase [Vibrio parahaemolyticus]TOG04750.1 hypothetical protein CGJ11_21760 [Vibrio parahaemolyticus]
MVTTSGVIIRRVSVQSGESALNSSSCTFAQYRARYGSVRITEELNEAGYACCVNYVADIMKEKGIRARNGKGFKYSKDVAAMTNVADNLLR